MTENECRKILGLTEIYTLKEAKQAYRTKVLQTHPDRNEGSNIEFIKVNKAFEEIQRHLSGRKLTTNRRETQDTYRRRAYAEAQYKRKVQEDLYWKRFDEARQKNFMTEFKQNLKIGVLLVAIIILFCMLIGKLFDPEFNGTKNQLKNEQIND